LTNSAASAKRGSGFQPLSRRGTVIPKGNKGLCDEKRAFRALKAAGSRLHAGAGRQELAHQERAIINAAGITLLLVVLVIGPGDWRGWLFRTETIRSGRRNPYILAGLTALAVRPAFFCGAASYIGDTELTSPVAYTVNRGTKPHPLFVSAAS
jgi:hypothetical protein